MVIINGKKRSEEKRLKRRISTIIDRKYVEYGVFMIIFVYIVLAVIFIMAVVAIIKKPESIYKRNTAEQNPMEGKRVRFVENAEEPENADGMHGHLEAVGESNHHPTFYEKFVKRMLDIIFSLSGFVVLSPVILIISIWILIDDPGPIFFTQKRIGKNKQYFRLHKFRSMRINTPGNIPTHMLENPEQWITRSGGFIRAHSLDELAQIWDIFIGNMSVIGPRPGLWNQDWLTACRDEYGANDIKPGLTGWAQINGRDELEIVDKARLDGEYAEALKNGKGFKMDCKCFLGSLGVFKGDKNLIEGSTGEMYKREKK